MKDNIKIYCPDLDCPLLKSRKGGLRLVLLLLATAVAACGILLIAVALSPWARVVMILAILAFGVLVLKSFLGQQRIRAMSRSALVVEGDCITILTLPLDNGDNTGESLVGFYGMRVENGFNTEDLMGYGMMRSGSGKGSKAYQKAVLRMQDADFVGEVYKSGYGNVEIKRFYACQSLSREGKFLSFTGKKSPEAKPERISLPDVFGDVRVKG